ncbi:MAG: beta-lactamase family protein, partial [Candidatus Heimdallarchaeota archaeon]|nr:beta-lactamase family protein [Candidatus Heimdallarchaeota archaeon]
MKNKTYLLLVFLFSSTLVNAQLEPPHALNENQFLEFRRDLPLSQPKELPPDCFEALDLAFDNSVATSTIMGFTASLVTPDGSVWKRASGLSQELPTESLLTTDHLMGMASNTKSFVSATLLLMYEEGLLSLDDSIGTYIDEYPNIPSTVSIQQLLSHRSGISDYINENPLWIEDLELYIDSIWTIDNLLQAYVLEPNFPVDSTYSYSNTNYLLAALIIESIANVPWYEEVRARVLEPLNLTHTFSYPFESIDTNEISHMWIELDWDTLGIDTMGLFDVQGIGIPIEGYFSIASSAGNLLTTAEDLAIFRKKLHGGDLLLPATLEEMQT